MTAFSSTNGRFCSMPPNSTRCGMGNETALRLKLDTASQQKKERERHLWPSDGIEQAFSQERKLRSAKHRALDHFELLNLRFYGSIAVNQRESSYHSIFVLQDTCDKALQFGDLAGLDGFYPCIQPFSLSFMDHRQKVLNQSIGHLSCRTASSYVGECLLLLGSELLGVTNEEPDGVAGRELFGPRGWHNLDEWTTVLTQGLQEVVD